ncbi:MAG: hypothetical protein JO013_01910 [Alphaproteobacteria bacterium]|nr:hypothetical protein [Alphaproteobacteria bacterium]
MIGILLALLAPTATHPAHGVQTGYGKPGYNPDKMICVSRDMIGSRLQAVRECHRAQEWVDQEQQEHVGLMRKQFNGDPGCSGGNPAACHPEIHGGRDTPW